MIDAQKKEWNQFVTAQGGSFLQSWQWGEFQQALGRKIWRIEEPNLKTLVIRHELPLARNYLYCPRPALREITGLRMFLKRVGEIAEKEKSIFFKVEPENGSLESSISGLQFSKKRIQPLKTIILDLTKSEEELLKAMHPKTRYNIRLAGRKGVSVHQTADCDEQTMEEFLSLMKETAERDSFFLHNEDYYRKIVRALGRDDMIKIFLAKYNGKMIAANLVVFFGKTAVYLHGASDYAFRRFMAPYLLQWQAILEAKKDFQYYDFWGIDGEKWPGVTRFKKGFDGKEVEYAGACDLVFRPLWCFLYKTARKMRL